MLFTLDETVFSREIAPLAGFYPSVYVGAPWWFLDAPDAIRRFRAAVTETAGFTRTSGFIDDTRAFCSIPARHDMSRRLDAGFLARLVAEHRLDEDEAHETIVDLVADQPAEGVQAVTATTAPATAGHGRARAAGAASCTSASATSSAPTRPGTPTHAPDAAEWGIAAFTGRRPDARRRAGRAGRPLHPDHPRPPTATRSRSSAASRRAHAADDHGAWLGYLASPDVRW